MDCEGVEAAIVELERTADSEMLFDTAGVSEEIEAFAVGVGKGPDTEVLVDVLEVSDGRLTVDPLLGLSCEPGPDAELV